MNTKHDIAFKRCGCTDEATGRQFAGRCPQLAEPGHGSWYYAVQVTTVGGRKARYRRGGFPTREDAIAARQAILDGRLTGPQQGRRRWRGGPICPVRSSPAADGTQPRVRDHWTAPRAGTRRRADGLSRSCTYTPPGMPTPGTRPRPHPAG